MAMDHTDADLALRHFARIVESSDDAIVSKDLEGVITSWNPAAERMFGYTAAEAVGRSIRIIIPAERQSEEDYVLSQIRAGLAVNHFETQRRRKDGTLIPISLTVSPILDDTGRVVGASKIARDITERVRLAAALREQAEIDALLAEVGALVVSSFDRTVIAREVLQAAAAATGAEAGAFFARLTGQREPATYAPTAAVGADLDAVRQLLSAPAGRDGQSVVGADEATASRAGEERPEVGATALASQLAIPVKTPAGDELAWLCLGHSRPDAFTERHRRLVSGIAAWASVALENARLYVEAREADRLKDEFLAVLSHELRTPLNAVTGYARLLRDGVLSGPRAERAIETVERNAALLSRMVEDVLDVSRIVLGRMRLELQPLNVANPIQTAVATMQPAALAKGLQLETAIEGPLLPVDGDAGRLQQILWNLLSNAVKFTPSGGRIDVRARPAGPGHVEIVVSDTGIGISRDFLPFVFDRFRQADTSATRPASGLGLGLSIVRHLVELHGGTIAAESDGEGTGARFRVRLPLSTQRADGAPEPQGGAQVQGAPGSAPVARR
jgi:PAS domain S-box-containing protein